MKISNLFNIDLSMSPSDVIAHMQTVDNFLSEVKNGRELYVNCFYKKSLTLNKKGFVEFFEALRSKPILFGHFDYSETQRDYLINTVISEHVVDVLLIDNPFNYVDGIGVMPTVDVVIKLLVDIIPGETIDTINYFNFMYGTDSDAIDMLMGSNDNINYALHNYHNQNGNDNMFKVIENVIDIKTKYSLIFE